MSLCVLPCWCPLTCSQHPVLSPSGHVDDFSGPATTTLLSTFGCVLPHYSDHPWHPKEKLDFSLCFSVTAIPRGSVYLQIPSIEPFFFLGGFLIIKRPFFTHRQTHNLCLQFANATEGLLNIQHFW